MVPKSFSEHDRQIPQRIQTAFQADRDHDPWCRRDDLFSFRDIQVGTVSYNLLDKMCEDHVQLDFYRMTQRPDMREHRVTTFGCRMT